MLLNWNQAGPSWIPKIFHVLFLVEKGFSVLYFPRVPKSRLSQLVIRKVRGCGNKGQAVGQQFSSVTQSCPTLCDPVGCSTPRLPVHHQFPELTQTHIHRVGNAIQPSHPLSSPSAFNLSQHQGLFQWVSSSHQVAKVLEFQLQHQSFQWTFRTDFL